MIIYKKQHESGFLFYWCLFVLVIIMLGNMIEAISKSPFYIALTIIITGGMVWLFIFGGIKWIWNYYLIKNPFVLEFQEEGEFRKRRFLSKTRILTGIHGLFLFWHILKIRTRMAKTFEQVDIKLEEKHWFCTKKTKLWYWVKASKDVISIEEITDLGILDTKIRYAKTHAADLNKTSLPKTNFTTLADGDGGFECQYNPAYNCPKGGSISLKLKLNIQVKKRWKGRISFKHTHGDDYQSYGYLPIIIKHKKLRE